jgi:hypothetical protein
MLFGQLESKVKYQVIRRGAAAMQKQRSGHRQRNTILVTPPARARNARPRSTKRAPRPPKPARTNPLRRAKAPANEVAERACPRVRAPHARPAKNTS